MPHAGEMQHVGKSNKIPLSELVIKEIGGVRKAARLLGINPGDVTKWRYPREKKGCNGNIPWRLKPIILDLVQENNWDITQEEIIRGYRKIKEPA